VRHNIDVVLGLMHGDANRWRPHLKTTKCSRVWLEALRAGVRHFKVATTREAAVLLRTVDELLVKEANEDGAPETDAAPAADAAPALADSARTPPTHPRMGDAIPELDPLCPVTPWSAVVDVLIAYPLVGPAMRRAGQLARSHPWARLSVLVECEEAAKDLPPRVGCFVDVNPGMNRTGQGHRNENLGVRG